MASAAALGLAATTLACALPAQAAPSLTEQKKLVTDFFATAARIPYDFDKQRPLLQRLEQVPDLTPAQVRTWQADLQKLAAKGRKLEPKPGQQFFWDEPERGLFIVGGEVARPKGLMIGFHGGGVGSGDAWSAHGMANAAAGKLGWLAIFPEVLEKTERGWTDSGTEEFVLELIAAARRTWKLDPDKLYFSGHSMGGYASWTLGAHHADMVAALAPSAGAPTPILDRATGKATDVVEGVIPSLRNVPMVIFQSADDPRVPPDANRVAVEALKRAQQKWGGYPFEYWEVDGVGHGPPPGGVHAHLEKIAPRARDPRPAKIVWQPALTWKRQFYWLYWHRPIRDQIVVAEVDKAENAVHVRCENGAETLEVLLDEKLVDPRREVTVTLNGKDVYRGALRASLAALCLTWVRNDPGLVFPMRVPLRLP
jgi:pimeloyl-ACP methyl ester carboxylesterase